MSEGPVASLPSREEKERDRDAATPCGTFCAEFSVVIDGPGCSSGECVYLHPAHSITFTSDLF